MKKLKASDDGIRVLTGTITEGTYNGSENRLHLFDGRFDTGFRIVSFTIAPASPALSQELVAKLSTQPKSDTDGWLWNDVEEVGWAHWGADKYHDSWSNIRENTMIIEDLWISAYNETIDQADVNYEIILQKYDLGTDWQGSLAMVRNRSQA